MKKLVTRALSGLVYVAIIVCAAFCGETGIMCLALLLGVLAVLEFSHITHHSERRDILVVLLNIAGICCFALVNLMFPVIIWFILWTILLVVELYRKNENPIASLGNSALIQLYIGLPLAFMVVLNDTGFGLSRPSMTVLLLFCCLWINDTGAFLTGSLIGKHKLFPRISPAKTWEGFFGGFLLVIAACVIFWRFCPSFFGIPSGFSSLKWIGLGVVISVAGTFGDLLESLLKRSLHIKDSGNIMPGHGGILDRIDSFLLAMPAMFIYLLMVMSF